LIAAIGVFREKQAIRDVQGRFYGIRKALFQALTHHDPVHDDIDRMFDLLIQGRDIVDFVELPVHFNPLETALAQFREFLAVFALTTAYQRRQQVKPRAVTHFHDAVDHLADRLTFDGKTRCGRIGNTDTRPEKAHIVIDLRYRTDCGARVPARRFLFDRNSR